MYSKNEELMWIKAKPEKVRRSTPTEINEKYENGEQRIVTETNREKLPNFVGALVKEGYMQLRPFYQRRARWDVERQSKLIESFIINIPVPPVFLYEKAYNQYEVMDGQQRISAIQAFYNNEFKLAGLEIWPELNGLRYHQLPDKVKAGLDRRSISSIVLLKESAPDEEEAIILRQQVFERLNTGGVKLERQEIRNALGEGVFNSLLIELSRNDAFRRAWSLPPYSAEEDSDLTLPIYDISFFAKMEDLEVVLRFFALRHMSNFRYGLQGFLDLYMSYTSCFDHDDIGFLRRLFLGTIELVDTVFGEKAFRMFQKGRWNSQPSKGVYDAQMVALSELFQSREALVANRESILREFEMEFVTNERLYTGRASLRSDIDGRINNVRSILKRFC